MKSINRAIDKFCYKHPRFGIQNLMLYIIIGNILVYLLSIMDRTGTLLYYLYFSPSLILKGQVWRLITFIFIPNTSNIFFLAIVLYFYYSIGTTLERQWGAGRFTIYYFSGVLLTVLFGFVAFLLGSKAFYFGFTAYYINMSMFFAFAALYPDAIVMLFFIIPIKIKWLAYIDAAYFVVEIIAGIEFFPLNLLPVIAFLNFFIFCWDIIFHRSIGFRSNFKQKTHFKSSVYRAEAQSSQKSYNHKCAVCSRTDTDYPNLEFRYCSRCEGYHCFCEDHINNHVHFTE